MTADDIKMKVRDLQPETKLVVPYAMFAAAFPPGVTDRAAEKTALRMARECGCRIENKEEAHQLMMKPTAQSSPSSGLMMNPLPV